MSTNTHTLLFGSLCGLSVVGGCASHAEATHHEEGGRYVVTHPLRTTTTIEREYVAQIRAIQHIEVRALERGYVQGIYVDEGRTVRESDLMFQIMPMVYQAELQRASAEAQFASIEYDNTRALHEGHVVSENELKLAAARRDKAAAERSLAKAHYDLAQIRAPFNGMMGRLEVRKGSLVDEGELLTTLSDNHDMWVYFNVSESEYLAYQHRVGHEEPFGVQLRLANGETYDRPGVVDTIEADFNNETGNIAFRATFPNPDGLLRHGGTGNIVVSTNLNDALLIPQKATFDVLDKKYVYVVTEAGIAEAREITVGQELPHLYAVATGLTGTEQVLLDGLRKVRPGQEVETVFEAPEEAFEKLDVPAE